MQNKMINLLGLALAGLFFTGCASNSAIRLVNQPDRSLVIVPVKGQPINVHSIHSSTVIGFGLVGAIVERSMAANPSEILCEHLNQDTNFDGNRILAEECANILKTSSKVAFHDVTIHPLDVGMPGGKEMPASEQPQFKATWHNAGEWVDLISKWRKSPPVVDNPGVTGKRAVYLEVNLGEVYLNHGDQIGPAIIFWRLVDSETGKPLGDSRSSVYKKYDITAVTTTSDLRIFETDFRRCMNESARVALSDLGLCD